MVIGLLGEAKKVCFDCYVGGIPGSVAQRYGIQTIQPIHYEAVFCAIREYEPTGWLALLLIKVGDVATNPVR